MKSILQVLTSPLLLCSVNAARYPIYAYFVNLYDSEVSRTYKFALLNRLPVAIISWTCAGLAAGVVIDIAIRVMQNSGERSGTLGLGARKWIRGIPSAKMSVANRDLSVHLSAGAFPRRIMFCILLLNSLA
jgi:hypothetical protein